ncbi:MAG: hypothetical protein COT45_00580 [bacterium (Candidatus Stahlbacteria) CG08_land_8_20_14_0_20_40_26]|nr:MAG: hypothetical protein COT45_00580 [bacterium (Candidatus Stahlbacteria) CG08_land_8_20_14_0_20_40_26]
MINITKKVLEMRRARQIVGVFVKHGFGYLFERIRKGRRKDFERSDAERFRKALEELGPIFIKMGQILSTRIDILPKDYIFELSKLQDETTPLPVEKIKTVIESELRASTGRIFDEFSPLPIASASLAQVHTASKDERELVVKIQRPGIWDVIKTDLDIMEDFARSFRNRIRMHTDSDPVEIVREMKKTLLNELDFASEGMNIEKFRRNFSDDERVFFPEVLWNITTPKVLVMKRIKGIKISKINEIEKAGLDRKKIASVGADMYFKQIFKHGFFHADPHPGNIFVTYDGKIAPCDFGMVGKINPHLKEKLRMLLVSVVKKDIDGILGSLFSLGIVPDEKRNELIDDIYDMLDKYYDIPIGRFNLKMAHEEGFLLLKKYKITLPRNLTLLAKALMEVEALGNLLDPEFDVINHLKPYIREIIKERYSVSGVLDGLSKTGEEYIKFLKNFPQEAGDVLKKAREGKLKFVYEHKGLDNLTSSIDKASVRLGISFIFVALVVSSSILIGRFPFISIAGFAAALILFLWFFISLKR